VLVNEQEAQPLLREQGVRFVLSSHPTRGKLAFLSFVTRYVWLFSKLSVKCASKNTSKIRQYLAKIWTMTKWELFCDTVYTAVLLKLLTCYAWQMLLYFSVVCKCKSRHRITESAALPSRKAL